MSVLGISTIASFATDIVDRFFPKKMDEEAKTMAKIQLEDMISKRDNALIEAQKSIMVAELEQGDSYVKRARPSIVYFGLVAIGLVNVLLPVFAWTILTLTGKPLSSMPTIQLPGQFWLTWGGVCSIWIIGRSAEKRGINSKVTSLITGTGR